MIFFKRYKKLLQVLSSVILIFFILLGAEYTALTVFIPEEFLKKGIASFFMGTFNKAVLCDGVSLSPFCTVVVSNFALSNEGDFNDNVDLIKCREVRIGLSITSLIRKKIDVCSIDMDGAEITLVKKSASSYPEFADRLLAVHGNAGDILAHAMKRSNMRIKNSRLTFREICASDTISVLLTGFDCSLSSRNGTVDFSAEGIVSKGKTGWIDKGFLRVDGSFTIPVSSDHIESGIVHFLSEDFDLAYLDPILKDSVDPSLDITGAFSSEVNLCSRLGSTSITGRIGLDGLSLEKRKNETDKVVFISDEKISSTFTLETLMNKKTILRQLNIDDGTLSLSCSGVRNRCDNADSVELSLSVLSSDIKPLFDKYLLLKPYECSGIVDLRTHVGFDLTHQCDDMISGSCSVRKFVTDRIKSGNFDLKASRSGFSTSIAIESSDADLRAEARTDVAKWNDFESNTSVDAFSKSVNGEILGSMILGAVDGLYSYAWDDRKRGYEDIKFLSTPVGIFVNRNNLSINYTCDSIQMGKAALKGGRIGLRYASGRLTTEKFELSGYSGKYLFKMDGLFNSDFPQFKIESSFDNFDLASACADAGIKGVKTSLLSGSCNYTLNGNRLSHIVENGTIDLHAELKNADIQNEDVLNRFYSYFNANGIKARPAELVFSRLNLSYRQIGENGIVTEFSGSGDSLNFSGFGKYTYNEGIALSIPSPVFASKKADGSIVNETAPFTISGRLFRPVLSLVSQKKSGSDIIIYQID